MQPELWGGFECTVNRVGGTYYDQLERTGHDKRLGDLDLVASLDIRTVRYPVLWERTNPDGRPDWRWPDERLHRLEALGIEPIVGLLHHGSGPLKTSLLDHELPEKFSSFARSVAERYQWIGSYIPVNEPLTTARFSCLYGHWYPHHRDATSFCRALLVQCRAVVLAMREIRKVNPAARLIQTEDFSKIFSTPALAYQAEFENHRRWLTWDLLCGCVDRHHPLLSYFLSAGIPEDELFWFLDNPCPPNIVGINHYVTSDRFLDESVDQYPKQFHGGNGKQNYADVEAVRVLDSAELGIQERLREVWTRYRLPIAVTEAHLGCADEVESVLWFREVWEAAVAATERSVDIRAVTAWALLGAYDWDSLLTRRRDHYERGAFELSNGTPRETRLAQLLRHLSAARLSKAVRSSHEARGWWRRPERIHYPRAVGC